MKNRLLLLTFVALAGCSRLEPKFQPRATYNDLIPEAKQGVDAAMQEYFGTPTEMKIWETLPLRHSGAVGTVVEPVATDAGAVTGLKVEWQEETWPIQPGQTVGWLKENLAVGANSQLAAVAKYDPATQVITFREPLASVPENGTRLAVAAGEVLHQGRLLYAEHCQHCHGVAGDGNGPTAKYLNPLPRDYRDAKFKFTSTPYTHPASRADLARVIEDGIPGTYMPSFKLLEPQESDSLVEYVRWLSMRGQCETLLIGEVAGKESVSTEIVSELLAFLPEEAEAVVAGPWVEADTPEIVIVPETERPAATLESIAIGQKLFISVTAKCSDCHGKSGARQRHSDAGDRAGSERAGTARRLGAHRRPPQSPQRYLSRRPPAGGHLSPHRRGDQGNPDERLQDELVQPEERRTGADGDREGPRRVARRQLRAEHAV